MEETVASHHCWSVFTDMSPDRATCELACRGSRSCLFTSLLERSYLIVGGHGLWSQTPWVQLPVLIIISCRAVGTFSVFNHKIGEIMNIPS